MGERREAMGDTSTADARTAGGADFFTHTAYWDVHRKPDTFQAPHIVALRNAIDLADTGTAIDLLDGGADPDKHEAE